MNKDALHKETHFSTVRELIEWAGDEYGNKCAYSYKAIPHSPETTKISFSDFRDDVRAMTTELIDMGCIGKHCAVIGKFSYEWAVTYFSILSCGGVIVPLDKDWTAEDLADTVARADAEFIFTDCDQTEKLPLICKKASISSLPIILDMNGGEGSVGALVRSGMLKFAESSDAYYGTPIDPKKMSLLVFTSGTTGKGKGVMLSQKAILSDVSSVTPYVDFSDKTVGVLPPHHTYGSTVMFIGHTMIGSEVYISAGIRYIQRELKEQKPGHLVLVPLYLETFYRRIIANVKEKGKLDFLYKMIKVSNNLRKVGIDLRKKFFGEIASAFGGEVKMIISGGAPINPEILHFFDSIGISTLNGYGITECAPIVAVNRTKRTVPGSVGPVVDIDTVKIDDPNEDGEGEICVKGSNVMLGYYKDDQATADAFDSEGYFRTGDYGKLDENNVLYITGRKKNLIILSNGKNVYPEEIENELIATPGILDIIVYEGQSKRGLEFNAIVAEIYPDKEYLEKNGIEDAKEYFKEYIKKYNAIAVPYKKISVVKVRKEEFPKNTLRKIMRFKLDMSID